MSQRSTLRSPRSPRSKSPSCVDGQQQEGAENIPIVGEIPETVVEELRRSDRILSQAQQSRAGSRGAPAGYTTLQNRGSYQATGAQSRASYHPSASSRSPRAPSSRIPSPRGSGRNEEEPPRLTMTPMTPSLLNARIASPAGSSQPTSFLEMAQNLGERGPPYPDGSNRIQSRGAAIGEELPGLTPVTPSLLNARIASPAGSSQPTSFLEMAQNPGERGPPYPDGSNRIQSRGIAIGEEPPQLTVTSATPPNCRSVAPSILNARIPSPAGSSQPTSFLEMAQNPGERGPPYPDGSNRIQSRGAAIGEELPGLTPVTPSILNARIPSPAGSSRTPTSFFEIAQNGGVATSHPPMREQSVNEGRLIGNLPAMDRGVGPGVVTFGNHVQENPYAIQRRAEPTAFSRQTAAGIGLRTSDLPGGGATSAMPYMPIEPPAAVAGSTPGYNTFIRDIGNAPASTPQDGGREPFYDQGQFGRQLPTVFPQGEGGGGPQIPMDHHMMAHDSNLGYKRPTPTEHHHHHHAEGHEGLPERDERVVAALGHLSQFKKAPSHFRCGLGEDLDFLKVCYTAAKEAGRSPVKVAAFPEIPCLRQEDIDELIKCETADVETAQFLTSDERKTYKKPCPKQQKAQMTVKALVQAHAAQSCAKEYSPMEHPDPEDISPEVAAAMMFSQEKGIKMEECPQYTITSLFPDEPKSPFPEKIPASSISIVDPTAKDREEMIEKSAAVPAEGVSHSAYTRTMKGKGSEEMGTQKSFDVDFAIGQSKREYVLVAQKPQRVNKVQFRGGNSPPWFPGYFSAFPDEQGLKVVISPSDLLHKAWIHSNPANIPSSDVIVLD